MSHEYRSTTRYENLSSSDKRLVDNYVDRSVVFLESSDDPSDGTKFFPGAQEKALYIERAKEHLSHPVQLDRLRAHEAKEHPAMAVSGGAAPPGGRLSPATDRLTVVPQVPEEPGRRASIMQ
jgi:hypothetical protein